MKKKTFVIIWLLFAISSQATTIYVDDDAPGTDDGSSWVNAYNYLQDALSEANSIGGPFKILVAEGFYKPDANSVDPNGSGDRNSTFQLISGVKIYGSYAGYGQPDPNSRDTELYQTILSGDIGTVDVNTDNSYNVVNGSGTDSNATLDGFKITRGYANGFSPSISSGAGIYCYQSNLTVSNCIITNNTAFMNGAGIACQGIGSPSIVNCTISYNIAVWGHFTGFGGGISCTFEANPLIDNCTIIGNTAYGGGGIYTLAVAPMIQNCVVIENTADRGAGMFNEYNAGPLVANCTFAGNSADIETGGISNHDSSPTIINCILWNNNPVSWGQIENYGTSSPTVSYCDVQGGYSGTGNIDAAPIFRTGPDGDYYLSQIAAGQASDSPCVDAGSDTAVNLGFDALTTRIDQVPDSGIVDMGYHYQTPNIADFDGDGDTDFFDYAIFAPQWFRPPGTPSADIAPPGGDGIVDFRDLEILVENWHRTLGGGAYDYGTSIQQTSDSGYIVAGTTRSFGAGNYDIWLIKLSAEDDDNDGVLNNEDKCPNTIEEAVVYGCSCKQILELKPGKDKGELKNGCSKGTIEVFTKQIGWAKECLTSEDGCCVPHSGDPDCAPIADFSMSPPYVGGVADVIFNGSLSYDKSEIILYEWDFDNDGIVDATGDVVTHEFNMCTTHPAGIYNITLTVYNDDSLSSSITKQLLLLDHTIDGILLKFNSLTQDGVTANTYIGGVENTEFKEYFLNDLDSMSTQLDGVTGMEIKHWLSFNWAFLELNYEEISPFEMYDLLDQAKGIFESRWYAERVDYNGYRCIEWL